MNLLNLFYFFSQKSSHDPGDIQKVHLSPPVGSRGFSDSDMSEFDYDDSFQTGKILHHIYSKFIKSLNVSFSQTFITGCSYNCTGT